jgi:hypothetical protein
MQLASEGPSLIPFPNSYQVEGYIIRSAFLSDPFLPFVDPKGGALDTLHLVSQQKII